MEQDFYGGKSACVFGKWERREDEEEAGIWRSKPRATDSEAGIEQADIGKRNYGPCHTLCLP